MKRLNKLAQEEMIGFAFIIVIVAVLLLIFVSFTLTKENVEVQSYEVESFMQSMLQYTSNCSDYLERVSIQKLIFKCKNREKCVSGEDSCDVLNSTLKNMLAGSWKIENTPILGYELIILAEGEDLLRIEAGNKTKNYRGSTQALPREIKVLFNAYS